jgi:hypothetical protein
MIVNLKIYEDLLQNDSRRFYPEHIPIITYEPLKTNFVILESPEDIRKGVLSLVSFKEEDLIAQCTGVVLNFQNLYTLQHDKGIYYYDPFFAGYLLHSCDPNAYLDMTSFSLYAIKKINPFSLITVDYEKTEDVLYNSFNCICGSDHCRGWIAGKLEKTNEINSDNET